MAESIAKKQSYLSARVQQHRAGAGAGFGAGDGAGAGASDIVQCDTASPVEGVPAIGGSWPNMMRAVPGDHAITAQDEMDQDVMWNSYPQPGEGTGVDPVELFSMPELEKLSECLDDNHIGDDGLLEELLEELC